MTALIGLDEQPFQASPLATPWQAGFEERFLRKLEDQPSAVAFIPQEKRSLSEALLKRSAP